MFNIQNTKAKSISCLALLILVNSATTVKAEQATDSYHNFDYGLPTNRRDGGSRGNRDNCVANAQNRNLVALVPEKTVGVNASVSPKLFFYVPKVNEHKTLEFVLRNEQDELLYEAFLTTEGEGIMSVEVPADVQSNLLETNQNYHWYLSMICNFQQRSRDIVVEGWMRQEAIDGATKQELNVAGSIEQAELYHEQGFWYDALSTLATNYQSAADRPLIRAKWSELLKSVGLEDLAAKPFIESEITEAQLLK